MKSEKKERYEWLVIQRSKKTGKPIRTVALDRESDIILAGQKNASEWIRQAIREKAARESGITHLTKAEEDVYSAAHTFFCQLSYKGERFPEQIDDETSTELFDFVTKQLSRLEDPAWESPIYALKLIEKARKDKAFWLELYRKIRVFYFQELRRPHGMFGEPL